MALNPNARPYVPRADLDPLPDESGTEQGTKSREDSDQESSSSRSVSDPSDDTGSELPNGDEAPAGRWRRVEGPEAAANSTHGTDAESQSAPQGGSDHARQSQDLSSDVDATRAISGGFGPVPQGEDIQKLMVDFNYIIDSTKKSNIAGFSQYSSAIDRIIADAENAIDALNRGKLIPAAAIPQIDAEKKMLINFYKLAATYVLGQIGGVADFYDYISSYVAKIFPAKTKDFEALRIWPLTEEITSLKAFFRDSNDFKEIAEKYISDIKRLTEIDPNIQYQNLLDKLYKFESDPPNPFNSSEPAKPLIETLKTLSKTATQDDDTINKVNETLVKLNKLHDDFSKANVVPTGVLRGGLQSKPTKEDMEKLMVDFNYIIDSTNESGITEIPDISSESERIVVDSRKAIGGLIAEKLKPTDAITQIEADKKILIDFYKEIAANVLTQIANVVKFYNMISPYVAKIFPAKTKDFEALKVNKSPEEITSLTKFFEDSTDFKEIAEKYISDIKPLMEIDADDKIRKFLEKLYNFESDPVNPFNSSAKAKPLIETLKTLSDTAAQDDETVDKVNEILVKLNKLHDDFIPIVDISLDELRKLPADVLAITKALILTELTRQDAKDIDLAVLNFMIADYLVKSKIALTQQEAKDCVTIAIEAAKPERMCATTVTSIIRNRLLPKHSIQESLVNLREETGKSNLAYIKSPKWALPPKFGQALNDIEANNQNIIALLGAYTNYKISQTPESYNDFANLYNTELGDSPSVFAF